MNKESVQRKFKIMFNGQFDENYLTKIVDEFFEPYNKETKNIIIKKEVENE